MGQSSIFLTFRTIKLVGKNLGFVGVGMESQDSTYLYEHCLLLKFNLVAEILEGEGRVLRGIPGPSP